MKNNPQKEFRPLTKGLQVYPRQLWKQILFQKQISVTIFFIRDFNKLSFRKHMEG